MQYDAHRVFSSPFLPLLWSVIAWIYKDIDFFKKATSLLCGAAQETNRNDVWQNLETFWKFGCVKSLVK